MSEGFKNEIERVTIVCEQGASSIMVGECGVDKISRESLKIDGDNYEHYVGYCDGVVVSTMRCTSVSEIKWI